MGDTLEEQYRYRANEGDIYAEEIIDLLDARDNRINELYNVLNDLFSDKKFQDNFDGYFHYSFAVSQLIRIANALSYNDNRKRKINPNIHNQLFIEEVSGE